MEGKKEFTGVLKTLKDRDPREEMASAQKLFRLFRHLTSPLPTRGRNEIPLREENFSEFLKLRSCSQVYGTLELFLKRKGSFPSPTGEGGKRSACFFFLKKKGFVVW